ncbi:hypothetical protein GQ53DRAFT_743560 [Thozetella sp. PMI_491]|nr:hypothetical protein GQ53DRAFT_743560 [Thozetella sp. PMI_491]
MESDHPRAPIAVVQQSATTALLVASCYARLVTSYNLLLKDLSSSYFSAARADISVFLTGRLKISMSPEISFGLHIHIISQVMHRVRKAMVAYSCCHWPLASEKCGIGGTWTSEDKTGVKPDEDTALAYILRAASTEIGLREKKLKSSLQAAGEDTALKGM